MKKSFFLSLFILLIMNLNVRAQDQQTRLTKVAEKLDAEGMTVHAEAADKVTSMMLEVSTAIPSYGYLGRKIETLITECKNVIRAKSCSAQDCDRVTKLKNDICKLIVDNKLD